MVGETIACQATLDPFIGDLLNCKVTFQSSEPGLRLLEVSSEVDGTKGF